MNADILRFKCIGIKKGEKFPFACTKESSPEFVMENLATGAKTFTIVLEEIIVLEDEKNPFYKSHTNWIVWNIPASNRISGVIPDEKSGFDLENTGQGVNYGRNQPGDSKLPKDGKHLYWFTIYVLDKKINLKHFPTKEHFLKKARRHIIQQGCLVGQYE